MFYIFLYNDRKGLNPRMNDSEFAGPVIGPVTSLSWRRGFVILHYADHEFHLRMTDYSDHVHYGGAIYNSFKTISPEDLSEESFYCGSLVAIHDISIFSKLINV